MRTINQTAPIQYQEIPSFTDDLEVVISSIECRLMETLTPQQFMLVQDLMEATRLLTEAELTLGEEILTQKKSA